MATQHDSHEKDSSFWGCANIFFGFGFALCALGAGGALLFGGLKSGTAGKKEPAPAPAPAPANAAPAAPAAPADPNTAEVTLRPGSVNPLSFDTVAFTVKAGQKVKVTFQNQHPTAPLPHNLIIGKIGSKERLVALSNSMILEIAKWTPKGFIPESEDVLAHINLVNPSETGTVEFTAPAEKGAYPYLCSYPGHAAIMQGTMTVE